MSVNGGYPSPGSSRAEEETRCARKCCWTPIGHSTVRDHLPSWDVRACTCHTKKEEN
jgi:hypothetical protein